MDDTRKDGWKSSRMNCEVMNPKHVHREVIFRLTHIAA